MPTQAERREATRSALLEAAMRSLVLHGYAATTTARVAEMAGVSRGAQRHYFASKGDLVAEALSHLARSRVDAIREAAPPDGEDRYEAILDLIWEAHQSMIFTATIELWVAAREDPQLAEALLGAERAVRRAIMDAAAEVAGPRANKPGFREDMELILAVARGLALLPLMGDASPRAVARRWRDARARLLRILA